MNDYPDLSLFLQNLWLRENADGLRTIEGKGGYSNGKYYPYKTKNGNTDVGPGFDMDKQTSEFKKKAAHGFTKEELDSMVIARAKNEVPKLREKISKKGGNPDKVSSNVYNGLLDMYWQLDNGLYKYNNFWDGVAHGDYEKMRKESATYYDPKNGKIPKGAIVKNGKIQDTGRWEFRKNTYFKDPEESVVSPKEVPVSIEPVLPMVTVNPTPAHIEYQDAIRTYRPAITPSNTVRDTKKAMQDKVDFHNFMDSISIQNNLPPAYTPKSNIHLEGGYMYKPRDAWEALSMPEKAEMMKVAVRNGIKTLPEIRQKYNEFAEGGSKKKAASGWYQQHQNRWYNFLKDKGLSDVDSARLSGFFTAQDDLESAGGKSNAAREKNNFGGMQRGGKNIKYNTVEDYMQDKWKMMNSKFKSALGAKNIDEYATILGNPETAGKGYLYYVTDKVKYDPKSSQWKAAQRQHMQNYINGMRSRAGMGTVRFNNQPIASAKSPTTPIVPIQSQDSPAYAESSIPFTLFNPEAFFATADTYQQPVAVEELEAQEPVVISPYSPEELDRQERMDRLSAFNNVLKMTSPQGSENVFLDAIGMLTGNTFANGGGIHIKPSHRGRLTELKKRTGKSEAELYKTGGPAVRKMITFARNARKWKHGLGGNLFIGEDYYNNLQ